MVVSSSSGPRPKLSERPVFISILTVTGPRPGCAASQIRMSSRQYSRFLFVPPMYRLAVEVAATQLFELLVRLSWLTFRSWVKTSGQTSSSISEEPASSARGRSKRRARTCCAQSDPAQGARVLAGSADRVEGRPLIARLIHHQHHLPVTELLHRPGRGRPAYRLGVEAGTGQE